MSFRVEISGLDGLLGVFSRFIGRSNAELEQLVEKYATDLEAFGKQNAPVLTGYLRDNIEKKDKGRLHKIVEARAHYSWYQEYGWTDRGGTFHAGRFYMTRAMDQASERLEKSENYKKLLARIVKD